MDNDSPIARVTMDWIRSNHPLNPAQPAAAAIDTLLKGLRDDPQTLFAARRSLIRL